MVEGSYATYNSVTSSNTMSNRWSAMDLCEIIQSRNIKAVAHVTEMMVEISLTDIVIESHQRSSEFCKIGFVNDPLI